MNQEITSLIIKSNNLIRILIPIKILNPQNIKLINKPLYDAIEIVIDENKNIKNTIITNHNSQRYII